MKSFIFIIKSVIFLLLVVPLIFFISCSSPVYFKGESKNMKNGYFYNSFEEDEPIISSNERTSDKGFWYWFFERRMNDVFWKENEIQEFINYSQYEMKESVEDLSVVYIGHSTFLIQINGINILTDPMWSERASPVSFLGPKRVSKPGVAIEDLPKIDYVLISHSHYDHLDLPTLKKLQKKFNPQIITGLGVGSVLKSGGIKNFVEKDWGEVFEAKNGNLIIYEKAKHWSKRTLFDANKALWGSFIIKSQNRQVFFSGDTGYAKHFEMINQQYGSFDVSMISIGAYEPQYIMKYSHLTPQEAVLAHQDLGSKISLGMHLKTFQLSDESFNKPIEELNESMLKQNLNLNNFRVLNFGERLDF